WRAAAGGGTDRATLQPARTGTRSRAPARAPPCLPLVGPRPAHLPRRRPRRTPQASTQERPLTPGRRLRPGLHNPALQPRGGRGDVRLTRAALGRIASASGEDWKRLPDLPVALSSGHSLDRERIRYGRRTKLSGEVEDPAVFESLREELFFLSNSDLLNEIV